MTGKTLHQLYAEHKGKVSDKWSLYLTEYDRLLDEYRDEPVNLLEIGIQNGGSLEIWSKYFKNYQTLIGCDTNPDCAYLRYEDPRIRILVGDAGAPETRDRIKGCASQLNVIIDDGSHRSSDVIKTFCLYFPLLASDGIYIVEDIHCSYWESFEGGLDDPFSAVVFFKRLADILNYEKWVTPKVRADNLRGFFWRYDCSIDEEFLSQIQSVEFLNSVCVVRKASVEGKYENVACEHLFGEYREKPLCLLEIGTDENTSLGTWSTYFRNYQTLIGCGIHSDRASMNFDDPRIELIAGDVTSPQVFRQITRRSPQFDIIVDQGSRDSGDMIRTFFLYFPVLANDGILMIRDIHHGYGEGLERALFDPFSAVIFLDRLTDILNYDHWGVPRMRTDFLHSFFLRYQCMIEEGALADLHSIKFTDSSCIIRKASTSANALGRRVIGGVEEQVVTGIAKSRETSFFMDQTFNPWTKLAFVREELTCAKLMLDEARRQFNDIAAGDSPPKTHPLQDAVHWLTSRIGESKKEK
jgi:cephalosporin hydroxylase